MSFIEHLDLVFELRAKQKKDKTLNDKLWLMSRPTAYRLLSE